MRTACQTDLFDAECACVEPHLPAPGTTAGVHSPRDLLLPRVLGKVAKPLERISRGLSFVSAYTLIGLLPLPPPRLYIVVGAGSQEGGGEVEPSPKVSSPWS